MKRIVFAALLLLTGTVSYASSPRYRMPCTPEPGWNWCQAPNRNAAIRDLPLKTKRILKRGMKDLMTYTATLIRDEGRRAKNTFIEKEGASMLTEIHASSGETLFLSLVRRNSKPTIDFASKNLLVHTFRANLSGKVGKRNPLMGKKLIAEMEKLGVYCHGPELVLFTDLQGNPSSANPVQTDLSGCTAD